jgi:hypothetical protein
MPNTAAATVHADHVILPAAQPPAQTPTAKALDGPAVDFPLFNTRSLFRA